MMSIRKQSGSILLTLMLVIIVAASFTLVSKLNASSRAFVRRQSTMKILQQAKAALIAYAVTYPERSADPTAGPGILPCPASNDSGVAISNCSYGGGTTLAKLPWATLDTGQLKDEAGELLWYAVTDNYRTPLPSGMVNDDVPGLITVGGADDIVAVIIAPGAPTDTQGNRGPNNITVNQYLEGVGVNGAGNDYSFTSSGTDILVYITRRELMREVEKRVSGDVVNALKSYQADTGVFPWLTAFDPDPATTDYDAAVNTREGSLAFNDINEVFPSQFSVSWDFRSGGNGAAFTLTPTATMPDWNSFTTPIRVDMESVFYDLDASVTGGPECRWIAKDAINCVGRAQDPAPVTLRVSVFGTTLTSVSGTRYYDFNVMIPSNGTTSICTYTTCVNSVRNRDVNLAADPGTYPATGFPAGTTAQVTITDAGTINGCINIFGFCWPLVSPIVITAAGQVPATACINLGFFGPWCVGLTVINGGSSSNTVTSATDADINVYETTYDLGVGDELPRWFTANNWHKYIYTAYSASDVPNATPPCVQGGAPPANCLTLQNTGPNSDNKQAIIVMAGPWLATQPPRASPYNLNQYFENENDGGTADTFERNVLTSAFNDQARVVAP